MSLNIGKGGTKIEKNTNMLQLKIPQGWMMKYSGVSRWVHPDSSFMLHGIKQFLAANKKTYKNFYPDKKLCRMPKNSRITKRKEHGSEHLPARVLQTNWLPAHRALGASLAPTRQIQN